MAVLLGVVTSLRAEADPNFYVFLCFGQSNMEGNADAETIDNVVDTRFRMLATCNFDNPKRSEGQWYVAKTPIVSPVGKLGPSDYFGRTMVAALPAGTKVGVVAVAMGGAPIEVFDKDGGVKKLEDNASEWWAILARNQYGGNPYQRLVDMGRKAQETGVIRGILLHQGCSNCGDPQWPSKVKKIYEDLLADLGLEAADVPLLVGETLRQDQGGGCYSHNTVVAKMPQTVRTSHVVSSEGCPGNGSDPWHFSAMGYRILGMRYALEMLKTMGLPTQKDASYRLPENLRRLYVCKTLEGEEDMTLKVRQTRQLTFVAEYLDGHRENVTSEVQLSGPDFLTITGAKLRATKEGQGTVTASYTDFSGTTTETTFFVTTENGNGIADVDADVDADVCYDLAGRRVKHHLHKGIYINRGKKILKY